MKRSLPLPITLAISPALVIVSLLACSDRIGAQPLIRPFTFVMPSYDSTQSDWLPVLPAERAGARGPVRTTSDGHLELGDGTPIRFVGVTMITSSCFPDSASAIGIAARLRKLGVNLVRFAYFDYHNANGASMLAPATRSDTLSASQMKRLDWFIHKLAENGIYSHLVLKSRNAPRADDGVPGWATTYNSGQMLQFFSEPMRAMQQRVLSKFLSHRNQYSLRRYADDPAVALITITDQASPWYFWTIDYMNERASVMSAEHSALLDTMFSVFLQRRYGTTAALRAAYREGIGNVTANFVRNPGFESFTDDWDLVVGESAQASLVVVQGTDVAPGAGANSLRVAVRSTPGVESRIYLQQGGLAVRRDGIYRVRFRAKTDTATGRPMRVYMFQGTAPFSTLGLDTSVALTTSWQTYETTFRAFDTDSLSGTLRFYIGRNAGDVFLDAIEIQETGRDGVFAGESLEARNISRSRFSLSWRLARRRAVDLAEFYDSLGRNHFEKMAAHLRSLGVTAPIAGTNNTSSIADMRAQAAFDFTSESALWDFNGARPGLSYSDSTWVIRQYSILNYRDQKIPELSRAAIKNVPFIAEGYGHAYPNRNRAEMMLFLPAYASLHDWDGAYLYNYTSVSTELATRRRAMPNDFYQIANDPSVTAFLPQFSAIIRNRWIAPAQRTIELAYDSVEVRELPMNYYFSHNNTYNTDGALSNVMNMVHGVRIGTFTSPRHLNSGDYYFTVPEDDAIVSDTREIHRDITKGTMSVNTPHAQGGSGRIGNVATLETDDLAVSWIEGAQHVTYIWSTLDSVALDSSRRSLLTIATRSLNEGAVWQFGDSSLGKSWGPGPTQLESVKLGLNFRTDADSLVLLPLDSHARPTGREIIATRRADSWRAVIDLGVEATPWFGVRQVFTSTPISGLEGESESGLRVGPLSPMPVSDHAVLHVAAAPGATITARIHDALGQRVGRNAIVIGSRGVIEVDAMALADGAYTIEIAVDGERIVRRFVVAHK